MTKRERPDEATGKGVYRTESFRSRKEAKPNGPDEAPPDEKRQRKKKAGDLDPADDRIADNGNALPLGDFIAFSPDHAYIHRPTREIWTAAAVNARVMPLFRSGKKPLAATVWLDRNDAVEQSTWSPGELEIIEGKLVAEGGFFPKRGARVFNLYKPPALTRTPGTIGVWRDRLYAMWPDDQAQHIEKWLAQRVQRPGEKINHALVLGGKQGIGKDFILEPLKRAVGAWNFREISPQAVLGNFNDFAKAVVLRISEAKDLGEFDRFAFYEATKTLIAAPPDTLRVNEKFVRPYYIFNVVGVAITTNHKTGGIYLPADDRRHFVAWSPLEPSAVKPAVWAAWWGKLDGGVANAVAHHLATLDISGFNPKAPPPRTQAFYEMVNAMRSAEESEMADVLESLGQPAAVVIGDIVARAGSLGPQYAGFHAFLTDRKNSRIVSRRLEDCGYRRLSNPDETQGRWVIGRERTGVYVLESMTDREGFDAVASMKGFADKRPGPS
jgi:hypothetical protein